MKTIILILACFGILKFSYAQNEWELKKDKDGITIYTRESEEGNLKEYKTSLIIEGSLKDVFGFLSDLENRPGWVINCSGLEIIDTTAEGKIRYQIKYDFPWPMSARDMILETEFSFLQDSGKAYLITNNIDLDYPLDEGVHRMVKYRETAFLEELDSIHTRLRAEGYADPGRVPAWIINMFLVNGNFDGMVRIREEMAIKNKRQEEGE